MNTIKSTVTFTVTWCNIYCNILAKCYTFEAIFTLLNNI